MTDPDVAFVAAVMDEIDQCRQPPPCAACTERMRSILARGAAAEREACARLAEDHACMADAGFNPVQAAALRRFADLLRGRP